MDKLLCYDSSEDEATKEDGQVGLNDFFSLKSQACSTEFGNVSTKKTGINSEKIHNINSQKSNNSNIVTNHINNITPKVSTDLEKNNTFNSDEEWKFATNHMSTKILNNFNNSFNFTHPINKALKNNTIADGSYSKTVGVPIGYNKYISKRKMVNSSKDIEINQSRSEIIQQQNYSKLSLEQDYSLINCKINKNPINKVPRKLMGAFKSHTAAVGRLRWCTADFSHLLLSTSFDNSIKVHDVFSRKCKLHLTHHLQAARDTSWSSDAHSIASCGFDKRALITDTLTGQLLMDFSHTSHLTCLKHHPGQDALLVVGSHDCILKLDSRSPHNPVDIFKFKDKMGKVLDLCFLSPDELASSCDFVSRESSDRTLLVWDFKTTAPLSNQIFHEKFTCPRLTRHPFHDEFLAQTQGDYIAQFSCLAPYRLNKRKKYNKHQVKGFDIGCDINAAGGVVVSGSADGQLLFYDYRTTRLLTNFDTRPFNETIMSQCPKNITNSNNFKFNNKDNNESFFDNFSDNNATPSSKTIERPRSGSLANYNAEDDDDAVLDVAWHPILPATCAYSTNAGLIAVLN